MLNNIEVYWKKKKWSIIVYHTRDIIYTTIIILCDVQILFHYIIYSTGRIKSFEKYKILENKKSFKLFSRYCDVNSFGYNARISCDKIEKGGVLNKNYSENNFDLITTHVCVCVFRFD